MNPSEPEQITESADKNLNNQALITPSSPSNNATGGSAGFEPIPKRKIPKWLKVILIILGTFISLIILLLLVFFILRTVSIQSFKNKYSTATSKCGEPPIMKVHAHGFKTNRTEVVTPENTSYRLYVDSNMSYVGGMFISYDVKDYYCSLEEAGIDSLTGINSSGVDFKANANLSYQEQKRLAKRSIESYLKDNSVKLIQPTFVPEILSKRSITVLDTNLLRQSAVPSIDNFPFTIYFGTVNDRSAITGGVKYECGVSDFVLSAEQVEESIKNTPSNQRYAPLEVVFEKNGDMRRWRVTYVPAARNIDEMKEDLKPIVCELRDHVSILSTEDSRRMMTEFTELNIDSFNDISYLN